MNAASVNTNSAHKSGLPVLALAALGVVYGDIGTSPLYTMKEVFSSSHHPIPLNHDNMFGILSLVLWSLIMVVSVKYVAFIMNADNRGEGGIMALLALANQSTRKDKKTRNFVMLIGIIGACMFYADGMITPAISVLSAVEGLQVATPAMQPLVIPVTLLVLFGLFWMQSKGTAVVGAFFGPIMLMWFTTLAILGVINILKQPEVLYAVNPYFGATFLLEHTQLGFFALGSVVLAVTGAEALYADMGHFGKFPIRVVWFTLVLPALLLNYFGQGALILSDPQAISNPFYLMAPSWMLYPLIGLATLAAVIASQAVISGAFSVSRQALLLGYLPRMHVEHTSESEEGQIYITRVNWGLMVMVMALVLGFGSSSALASAYGIAVTGDMVITTILAAIVFRRLWHWSLFKTTVVIAIFLAVDLAFFSANIIKIPDGGWFPILMGIVIFTLMLTWKQGRSVLFHKLKSEAMDIQPFVEAIGAHPPARVQGTAVFLTPNLQGVPHALLHNLKHNKVLHENVVLLAVRIENVPHVAKEERVVIEDLGYRFYTVTMRYGFKDDEDIPRDIKLCEPLGLVFDEMDTSYFVGKESLITTHDTKSTLGYWKLKLFIAMFRNADSINHQFRLPANRVVELGAQVTL